MRKDKHFPTAPTSSWPLRCADCFVEMEEENKKELKEEEEELRENEVSFLLFLLLL